jgi:ABC-2 type transport system permease protein
MSQTASCRRSIGGRIMVKLVLSLFDVFAWALQRAGVDYAQFRALLGVKLTLDGRRQFTAFQQRGGKASRNSFAWALVMNLMMGAFMAMLIPFSTSPLTTMTLVHTFVMVMVAMSLIADFSSVLLDSTDNQILQPRPISSRTILAARNAHIITYITLLTVSLAGMSLVVGTFKYGIAFPWIFGLTLVASVCFVIGAVNLLYLVAMRVTSGERLRDIILYIQMIMTILVIGGYQVVPRLIGIRELDGWRLADHWWIYLLPPAWLAAPIELITGNLASTQFILSFLGLVVPLAMLLIVLALAPGFRQALARLDATPQSVPRAKEATKPRRSHLAKWLSRCPEERAAFDLLWVLSGRDRQFKLRTYPSIAVVFVVAFGFLASNPQGLRESLAMLPQTHRYIVLLYICCALAPSAFVQMRYSDRFEAAWMYRVLPLARPGAVLRAALKVAIVRLALPSFAITALVTLAIWGWAVAPDLLLAFMATLLTCSLQALLLSTKFPFSEPYGVIENTGRVQRTFLYFLIPIVLGGIHYGLTFVPHGIVAGAMLAAIGAWLAMRAYGRTPWQEVMA